MIRRPPRSTLSSSSAASDVYKRQVYEGIEKIGISGNHSVLITGLGPVGLAAAAIARKLGAQKIIGIDVVEERLKLARDKGLCDETLASGPDNVSQVKDLTGGYGVERAVEC